MFSIDVHLALKPRRGTGREDHLWAASGGVNEGFWIGCCSTHDSSGIHGRHSRNNEGRGSSSKGTRWSAGEPSAERSPGLPGTGTGLPEGILHVGCDHDGSLHGEGRGRYESMQRSKVGATCRDDCSVRHDRRHTEDQCRCGDARTTLTHCSLAGRRLATCEGKKNY